jgi:ribosomal protein S6
VFFDLLNIAKTVNNDNKGADAGQALNKFIINDWAPKEIEEDIKINKRKTRIMNLNESQKEEADNSFDIDDEM